VSFFINQNHNFGLLLCVFLFYFQCQLISNICLLLFNFEFNNFNLREIVKHKTNFFNLIGIIFTISLVINLIYISLKQPSFLLDAKLLKFEGFGKTFPFAFMSFTNHFRLDLFHLYM
jgi:hypothetical protein